MSEKMSTGAGRVSRTHDPERVREVALSRERADQERRLAELEEFVRKHKKNRAGGMDTAVGKPSCRNTPRTRL